MTKNSKSAAPKVAFFSTWLLAAACAGCGSETSVSGSPDGGDGYDGMDTDTNPASSCSETHPDWTVGLQMCTEEAFLGYTLFAPSNSNTTYLIDIRGRLVHSWESFFYPGLAVYLLENGNLLRTGRVSNPDFKVGGVGGALQEIDWDGNVVWEFKYSTEEYSTHHDVEQLPNGNVLMIAWEEKTEEETIAEGRDPELQPGVPWADSIIEVKKLESGGGEIVWRWRVWDHLIQDYDSQKNNFGVVSEHPELIDFNYVGSDRLFRDWIHINSVDYIEEHDQIVVSAHNMSELWVIDHSTTAEQAASHSGGASGMGGDLLYRWGNPAVYRAGSSADQRLFGQHDVTWVAPGLPGAGDFLTFNNGLERPEGEYSSVDEIVPPVNPEGSYVLDGETYGPVSQSWIYTADDPTSLYSGTTSGADRLPNGNTLVTLGPAGHLFEVTPSGEVVWEYVSPVTPIGPAPQGTPTPGLDEGGFRNGFFKARRYDPDFPGLQGRDLTPKGYIELEPLPKK